MTRLTLATLFLAILHSFTFAAPYTVIVIRRSDTTVISTGMTSTVSTNPTGYTTDVGHLLLYRTNLTLPDDLFGPDGTPQYKVSGGTLVKRTAQDMTADKRQALVKSLIELQSQSSALGVLSTQVSTSTTAYTILQQLKSNADTTITNILNAVQ